MRLMWCLSVALMITLGGCDAIDSLGGKGGKGGGSGGGSGSGGGGDGGGGDGGGGDGDSGGIDLTSAPAYDWALASCEFLGECCDGCDGPYGWGEDIATLDDCIEYALGFALVMDDSGEFVPACPGPDYDAMVSCINGLECGQSVTFDCPDFDEDFVPCD